MKRNRITPEQELLLQLKEKITAIEQKLEGPLVIQREWLEPAEICTILHIARRTLAEYSRRGYIPYSRLGGRVYYRMADIDDYLSSHIIRKEPKS